MTDTDCAVYSCGSNWSVTTRASICSKGSSRIPAWLNALTIMATPCDVNLPGLSKSDTPADTCDVYSVPSRSSLRDAVSNMPQNTHFSLICCCAVSSGGGIAPGCVRSPGHSALASKTEVTAFNTRATSLAESRSMPSDTASAKHRMVSFMRTLSAGLSFPACPGPVRSTFGTASWHGLT